MPYYLVKTNGEALATVEDGTIDTSSADITLLGKNYPTYGFYLNENFVKLTENFANVDQPSYPLLGQLWYDSANKKIQFYREGSSTSSWRNVASIDDTATEPTDSKQGDMWYDTDAQQLKIYNGSSWLTIGPQTTNSGLLRISGTNSFTVQIGGTEVFNVDSNGRVTAPLNPVVQAFGRSVGTNYTGSSISSFDLWIPSSSPVNVGGYYLAGVFTCPVDGNYRVHVNLTTLGKATIAGAHLAQWRLNDATTNIEGKTNHINTSSACLVASGIISAAAGDEITLVVSADSGSVISYQNNSYSIELVS